MWFPLNIGASWETSLVVFDSRLPRRSNLPGLRIDSALYVVVQLEGSCLSLNEMPYVFCAVVIDTKKFGLHFQ